MIKKAISTKYPDHKLVLIPNMADSDLLERKRIQPDKKVSSMTRQHGLLIQLTVQSFKNNKLIQTGTMNFIHGIPNVAISIGFAVSRRPTVGVVLNPFTAQLYTGIFSQGSYLTTLSSDLSKALSTTKLPIYPPQQLDLQSSVVIIEFGSDRAGNNFDVKLSTFKKLSAASGGMVHALRSYGSAALNLCYVANGSTDGYWEAGCWEWDVCAGWVILKEAGGVIVDGNPPDQKDLDKAIEDPNLCGRAYLAVRSNRSRKETEEWIKKFWSLIDGKLVYGR